MIYLCCWSSELDAGGRQKERKRRKSFKQQPKKEKLEFLKDLPWKIPKGLGDPRGRSRGIPPARGWAGRGDKNTAKAGRRKDKDWKMGNLPCPQ